jgi:hypothetical protein
VVETPETGPPVVELVETRPGHPHFRWSSLSRRP